MAAPLLPAIGWRNFWLANAAAASVCAALLTIYAPPTPAIKREPVGPFLTEIGTVVRDPSCLILASAFFAYSCQIFSLAFALPVLLTSAHGMSFGAAGLLSAVVLAVSSVGHLASGFLLRGGVPIWANIAAAGLGRQPTLRPRPPPSGIARRSHPFSRWGRFQDGDEGATYEFVCRKAGVEVRYCGETFDNDGSFGSNVQKGVMRMLAGAHSRMLSQKVLIGQKANVERGYWSGSRPGFGLRRLLLDQHVAHKGLLQPGDRKSLQSDRVVLVPGPAHEIEVVRWIFDAFAREQKTQLQIIDLLNARGTRRACGRPWTRAAVRQVLTNEKYIGNNVWHRTSARLKQRRVALGPDLWVRVEGAFEPLIDKATFAAAARTLTARAVRWRSDQGLIDVLKSILATNGSLSSHIINGTLAAPRASLYGRRFKGLQRAYELAGFCPAGVFRPAETKRGIAEAQSAVVRETVAGIAALGGRVERTAPHRLRINDEFVVLIAVLRSRPARRGRHARWCMTLDRLPAHDLVLLVRMDRQNRARQDYYLLPALDAQNDVFWLEEHNGLAIDAYRCGTLEPLFALASRVHIRKVST